ncbi:PREDICTED: mitochondrial pyruvate carrier 2-like [Eufriesea mexicana]|uniref:mitochondrial pyruvate carrier 2-like n=1 Tax=Eufriesea mexicana TaxID=516756 RepID=UPI00083BF0C2|nr:PREDICTED: mitochondrial pyruvate carrier 2-like [Eufriesea mexicana]XP_017758368.1 PREDICTED: mitochondrial pyruvate carrier 2-like [Eufriesea mexicana]
MLRISCLLPCRLRPIFLHPAGPTTIFFWAPTIKWGLVLAGLGDTNRSPDTISLYQAASLMITGAIWSRYSLVVTPKNYNLFSVNAFMSLTEAYNFIRGLLYQMDKDLK